MSSGSNYHIWQMKAEFKLFFVVTTLGLPDVPLVEIGFAEWKVFMLTFTPSVSDVLR